MRKNILFSILSIICSFITFICLGVDGFYKSKSKSTMHVSGYGTSTSTTGSGSYTYKEISPALHGITIAVTVIVILAAIIMIVCIAKDVLNITPASVFFGFAGFLQGVFALICLFSPLVLGSSKTNGVSGAWKSSSTSFSLGAGGWFFVILAVASAVFAMASAIKSYMDN